MAAVDPSWIYDSFFYSLGDTSEHVVYTVPAAYKAVLVQQILVADTAGAANKITLKARVSGADYFLIYQGAIAVNVPYDLELKPMTLKTGDTIKATANASTLSVMVSFAAQSRRG